MANAQQTLAYAPVSPAQATANSAQAPISSTQAPISSARALKAARKAKRLSHEDMEIVAGLEAVRSDMEFLHNCFDHTTDAILIDSLVYEIKAANLKYQYYLNLCKERGIVCGVMPGR